MLTIEDVSMTYGPRAGGHAVLDDVNLTARTGESLCLLGASGCGKTTLIRIIAQLNTPTSGRVAIDGNGNYRPGTDVCMVFQGHGLFPWYPVWKNIEYGLKIRGVPRAERQEAVDRYLELIGLQAAKHKYPHELSGGMQQRVGLARALACQPRVLLLDEPFAAVDAQTRERLQDELVALWSKQDMTMVFVTHSIDEAVYLSDRIIVLRNLDGHHESIADEIDLTSLPRPRERTSDAYASALVRARTALQEATR